MKNTSVNLGVTPNPAPSSGTCSGAKYHNTHSLYIESGIATEKQIIAAFDNCFREASKKYGRQITSNIEINVVIRNNIPCEYAYVYVSNPEVYYALIGKNWDGSELMKEVPNPDYIEADSGPAPEKTKSDSILMSKAESILVSNSWADLTDDDLPCSKTIKVPDTTPLMELGEYEILDAQLYRETKVQSAKREQRELKHENVVVPKKEKLIPTASYVQLPDRDGDRDVSHHILYGSRIPGCITANDIRQQFIKYAYDPNKEWRQSIGNGRCISGLYPIVSINRKNGSCLVSFDRNSPEKDALFARQMKRVMKMTKNGETFLITFDYNKTHKDRPPMFDHDIMIQDDRDRTFAIVPNNPTQNGNIKSSNGLHNNTSKNHNYPNNNHTGNHPNNHHTNHTSKRRHNNASGDWATVPGRKKE